MKVADLTEWIHQHLSQEWPSRGVTQSIVDHVGIARREADQGLSSIDSLETSLNDLLASIIDLQYLDPHACMERDEPLLDMLLENTHSLL